MFLSLIAPMCFTNHAIKSVLDHFLSKLRFPNGNEMPKRSSNVSCYFVLFVMINFYVQILKLNFQGNNPNSRIKSIVSLSIYSTF